MPTPINTPHTPIVVEYDTKDGRRSKLFQGTYGPYDARSFFAAKLKAGKNPKVR